LLPVPRDSQALDWQSLWHNPNQQAEQAFNQQQYHKLPNSLRIRIGGQRPSTRPGNISKLQKA